MRVVERKPVPIYEVACIECKSKIQYKASEVMLHHITCPVCGVSIWADTAHPVKMDEAEEPRYCDRNLCYANEVNGIGCDECPVMMDEVDE